MTDKAVVTKATIVDNLGANIQLMPSEMDDAMESIPATPPMLA